MRILLLSQYYPPETGATGIRAETFAKGLAEAGHEVTVVAEIPNHPAGVVPPEWRGRIFDRRRENGFEVIRVRVYATQKKSFWRRMAFYGSYALLSIAASLTLWRRKPDVILATSPPLFVAAAAAVVGKLMRRPRVMDVRDIWPDVALALGELQMGRVFDLAKRMERWLYRDASAVTAVTRPFVSHIESNGASRVLHVPNGTLPEVFDPERQLDAVTETVRGPAQFVVGYTGNHGIAQGLGVIPPAARAMQPDGVRFFLLGEGAAKATLREQAGGLSSVVLHQEVPLADVAPYINACDAMLAPLRKLEMMAEFIPSKIFDYMCCGKPVIVMVDGEARRIVEDADCGIYVPAEDEAALVAAITELRNDPDRAAEMARNGREFVLANYVRGDQVSRLEDLLAEAARSRVGGAL
jgi:glycosyltransferase involved in cell wall biosynthesis